MQYDEDDYQFTHHHRAHLRGAIQIDETCEYECRAKSYWDPDIQYDFDFWQDRMHNPNLKSWRYRTDEIREARRTVNTFPKRKFVSKESKNYKIELAKYNRSLKILEQYGE
jgi:hypothetical protein